jgi:hypothetical protein
VDDDDLVIGWRRVVPNDDLHSLASPFVGAAAMARHQAVNVPWA